ncbi:MULTISPECIES: threonine--tRNA ligase [unclassified Lentimicrobium]|uniref:threonine--tRNA ligase n=1 Tax=unclassified Lentimicrobium TaxID=2677434 RepID=UPI0015530B11|nr:MULTISPECIES: threonine--tRNA ligase [unclassified Lentimicrobium]NPD45260.1 threonine--tRNA ligase [Lentimicrobium sp. S6]NPD86210.1 threonine--tRNA ligase [Lentimicrobium sp. L6]
MIKITLPDNSVKEMPDGSTSHDVALTISEGLARNVLAAKVNGLVQDASRPLNDNDSLQLLTWTDDEGKAAMWHSSAHLMAEAIEILYPGVKFGIGPDIENGFYYDVDFGEKVVSEKDLEKIEQKMKELVKQKQTYDRKEVSKAEALKYFEEKGDEYKLELINDLEDGEITFYQTGEFTDLCRGPHLINTSPIKAIKLLKIAGAYWRGDEKRKMLTRIYGITFTKKAELKEHLELLEEAKKRDHRKLGKELELFAFSEKVGKGLPLWLPKGAMLRERLENFLKKVQKRYGYQPVITPHIGQKELYVTSGHYAKYGEDSFQPIKTPVDNEEFLLKPMNCPHHCEIFKTAPRSYKDLPIRFAEFGTVYRYEQSGELHGLTRVRGFTQDDAHIFCMPEQVKDEFKKVMDIIEMIFKALDFKDYLVQISLRDQDNKEKYIGSEENWEYAENAIREVAEERGIPAVVEYGEAAFYGPKMDFMVKDALGRKWQLGTIQVDYNLPERFELEYVGSDNEKHRPVMIHRAPFGSMERFVAVLIEHCGGNFPLWLTPEQLTILPISDKYQKYAEKVFNLMENAEIRAQIDTRSEKMGRKIRDAEMSKIPYMLVVGEKEEETGTVSVRRHGEGDLGTFKVEELIEMIQKEVEEITKFN